jgi:ABC-type methionine transport system ATPase subunit
MISARVRLTFPDALVRQPVIGELVRKFGVMPNIRRADVDEDVGWIVCELDGTSEAVNEAISWLEAIGIGVEWLDHPLES